MKRHQFLRLRPGDLIVVAKNGRVLVSAIVDSDRHELERTIIATQLRGGGDAIESACKLQQVVRLCWDDEYERVITYSGRPFIPENPDEVLILDRIGMSCSHVYKYSQKHIGLFGGLQRLLPSPLRPLLLRRLPPELRLVK